MSRISRVWTSVVVLSLGGAGAFVATADDASREGGGQRVLPRVSAGAPGGPTKLLSAAAPSAQLQGGPARLKVRRERSQTAFRGLDATAALTVARRAFPELVNHKGFRARRPQKDMRLVRMIGTFESQVITAKGQRLLAKSTTPLRARRPDGTFAPVDMTLKRTDAGAYVPRNAVSPVTLGASVTDGTRIDGAKVTIAPSGARAVTGMRSADTVFYPNVYGAEKDTDFVAKAQETGAQVHWQLRSPRADVQLPLDVQRPEGAKLRRAVPKKVIPGMPRSIEVYKGDESLAYISAPLAYDADGTPVPASAEIVGDRIAVNVEHRSRAYRYPIHVDPIASDGTTPYVYHSPYHRPGQQPEWQFQQWGTIGYTYGQAQGEPAYGYGLLLTMPTNSNFPARTSGSKWLFTAPAGTKTVNTVFSGMDHSAYTFGPYVLSGTFQGLANPGATAWLSGGYGYVNAAGGSGPNPFGLAVFSYSGATHHFHCRSAPCENPANGNTAQFGFQAYNQYNNANISTGSAIGYNRVQSVTAYLTDTTPPEVTNVRRATPSNAPDAGQAPDSNRWRDYYPNTTNTQVSWDLRDYGAGTNGATVTGAPGSTLFNSILSCGSTQSTRTCQFGSVDYRPNEGVNTITITGRDLAGNTSPYTYTDRIDTQQPTLGTPTGNLWEAREQPTDHRAEGFYDDQAILTVPVADASSGVKEVVVLRNGAQWGSPATVNNGVATWSTALDPSVTDGRYKIEVVARDNVWVAGSANAARHEAKSDEFHVTIDRTGDVYAGRFVSGDPAADGEVHVREWARAGTNTARRETPGHSTTTRSPAVCADGATNRVCESVRTRTRIGAAPVNATDDFTITRGDADDSDLQRISQLLQPARHPDEPIVETGSLTAITKTWQVLPPAHGTQFNRYDFAEERTLGEPADEDGGQNGPTETFTQRLYVDAATDMPVRQVELNEAGEQVDETFWTYDLDRKELSSYATDFFEVAEPATPNERTEIQQERTRPIPTVHDQETNTDFQPWSFGSALDLSELGLFCLARNDVNLVTHGARHPDEVPVGEEDPSIPPALPQAVEDTFVTASYHLQIGTDCHAGLLPDDSVFTVTTFAKDSTEAGAWRSVFEEDSAAADDPQSPTHDREGRFPLTIGTTDTIAHLVPGMEGIASALMDLVDTTVMITGPLDSTLLTAIASQLGRQA